MSLAMNRRDFLAVSAGGAALLAAGRSEAAAWKTKLHKALIGAPTEATLASWKAAGFEGMESDRPRRIAREGRRRPASWPRNSA